MKVYPAVLYRLFPALSVFADAHNDVETVVTSIQTLSVAL